MATTLQTLKTYYSNVMRADFAHIPSAHSTLLTNLSAQVDAGSLTLAAAQTTVARLSIDTTSVATLAYNFFTGATPYAYGLDYLVSPTGPNANNLNSAYYQSANIENRYINFAVNLGKLGEGQEKFAAGYGALGLSDTLIKAYTEIFGAAPDAAKVNAILNDQVANGVGGTYTRADYFAFYGRDGLAGIGTKAALVGWLMAEAEKADVGAYAQANDAFLADLGPDGVARFHANLGAAYGPAAPTGTAGAIINFAANQSVSPASSNPALQSTANNDTITGTAGLDAGQTVNGGAGNDTYVVSGTVYGKIQTGDGNNKLTVGDLGQTVATLGVPSVSGSVTLGSGVNDVTLKGSLAAGTSITATGASNTLHLAATSYAASQGTVSGFQTVYIETPFGGPSIQGAAVIYDVVSQNYAGASGVGIGTNAGQLIGVAANNHELVVLKDTPFAVNIYDPTAAGAAQVDVHLQNFRGAASTGSFSAIGGYYQADGGAIKITTNIQGLASPNGKVVLHVDTESTAGLIFGYGQNQVISPAYKGPLPNLTIVGPGSLSAQISDNFSNVDATQAGDLSLVYFASVSQIAQTVRLGDATNTLKIGLGVSSSNTLFTPAPVKFFLGAGTDTVILATGLFESPTSGPGVSGSSHGLGNLHIENNAVVSNPAEIVGFQKGVDHLVLDPFVHTLATNVQAFADGRATLTAALIDVSARVAADTAAIFSYGGDTYIYTQDERVGVNMRVEAGGAQQATGDGLVKLVGVTGLSVGTGAANVDIHYG